jgi:HPt (histidine-containing phosphotransfer) domain-containing protein
MPDEPLSTPALERLREWGGEKLLRQMVRLFLENAGERRRQVAEGLAPGGDLLETERGAHSLKSGAANVGAARVSAAAALLEEAAEARDRARCRPLAEELEAAFREAEPHLRKLMQGRDE